MVALLENSPLPSKTALRARGATLSCASRLPAALRSSNRIELGRFTYDACRRLGLCSNDSIGYWSRLSLYGYVSARPTILTDPLGLHDPTFDPFRDKIRIETARMKGLSTCLANVTGLGGLLDSLASLLSSVRFTVGVSHHWGIFGAASTEQYTIFLPSTDPNDLPVSTLIHEMVHVYDYDRSIFLDNYWRSLPWPLGNPDRWLFQAENLAYATEFLIQQFENLARFQKNLTSRYQDYPCERIQKEFDGVYRLIPAHSYSIWVKGRETRASLANLVIASDSLGLDFSCENIRQCMRPPPCCEITCSGDAYSEMMKLMR